MTNAELAQAVRDLQAYLIVAGYDETFASRYTIVARSVENHPEPVETLRRTGRLTDLEGVGKTIAMYLKELIDTGTCSKYGDWEAVCPRSVLEVVRIPGIGPRTARRLFLEYGIEDLAGLRLALEAGILGFLTEPQRAAIAEA
jgi:DNA polymerase (family 10)